MKRLFCAVFSLALLLNLAAGAAATEVDKTCGEDLIWAYEDGVLTISGSGDMDDLSGGIPWEGLSIRKVVLTGGVTSVGAGAFFGSTGLTEVDFGDSLREIGENAFRNCTGLTTISLPATFRLFGASSFEGCTGLTTIHCAGGMPSFRSNCLWNYGKITIYCPDNAPWSESYVGELETNFNGRLEVLTESGVDIYVWPEEETTAPTEMPTEAPTVPTTEPTTVPTQEPTVATTVPATQPATEEGTQPVPATVPETTAPASAELRDTTLSGVVVGVFILSGALSLILIGLLIFKGKGRHWD